VGALQKSPALRVVLDTNTVVSALLFKGETSRLAKAWQERRFIPLASPACTAEYLRVLRYPKFRLSEERYLQLIHQALLPYLVAVSGHKGRLSHPCSDPDDDIFLRAALGGKADHLVTGDAKLLELKGLYPFEILTAKEFSGAIRSDTR
jgi:uncharacterized protein